MLFKLNFFFLLTVELGSSFVTSFFLQFLLDLFSRKDLNLSSSFLNGFTIFKLFSSFISFVFTVVLLAFDVKLLQNRNCWTYSGAQYPELGFGFLTARRHIFTPSEPAERNLESEVLSRATFRLGSSFF